MISKAEIVALKGEAVSYWEDSYFAVHASRPVQVVLFQSEGHGNFQKDVMPSFSPDFKSPLYGLSIDVSFVQEFFLVKMLKIFQLNWTLLYIS